MVELERASTVATVSFIVYPLTVSINDPLLGMAFFVLNATVAVEGVIV
jgi:hypothetical protein